MKTNKTYSILSAVLVAVFALTGIGIGIFASSVSANPQDYQTSVIKIKPTIKTTTKKTVAKKSTIKKISTKKLRSAAGKLYAQLENAVLTESTPPANCDYPKPETVTYSGDRFTVGAKFWSAAEDQAEVSIYVKNTGNVPWFNDNSPCKSENLVRLGTAHIRDRASVFYNPSDSSWLGPNRIKMVEERVDPGQIATFKFIAKAPNSNDIFREYFQPVIEGKQWLETEKETPYVDIYVGAFDIETATDFENRLKYFNWSGQSSSLDINGEKIIEVDISDQTMQFKIGNSLVREYKVSTGTYKTPTPVGRFAILEKKELRVGNKYPHYYMPKWQGFTQWGHGLHALPYLQNDKGVFWEEALSHIGRPASHGCIRLLPDEAADLYSLTEVGIPVVVKW